MSGYLLFSVSVGDRRGQRSRSSAAANFERERERGRGRERVLRSEERMGFCSNYGKFLLV
jgi:hypothetical protein